MPQELQMGLALSRNSERYLEFLLWTISRTADNPDVKLILGVNHDANIDEVRRIASGWDVEAFDAHVDSGYGSMNHGICLDLVFQRMESGLGMLVDCDVAFLRRGWDTLLASTINGSSVITGAEYDGDKYMGFPNVIGAMFDVGTLRDLGVSFKPEGRRPIAGEELVTYGYPIDGGERTIILDTGSELPRKIKEAGLKGIPMPIFRPGDPKAKFVVAGLRGEEYQFADEPIFTHLGRSYTREFGVNEHAVAWDSRVREWLA